MKNQSRKIVHVLIRNEGETAALIRENKELYDWLWEQKLISGGEYPSDWDVREHPAPRFNF